MDESNKTLFIVMWVITFFPCYRMARKAGFGWPMAIFLSIPVIHYITLYFFAFKRWPTLPNA
ncbi:hypothetical protein DQ02_18675 [Citrobacter amalonaticus]|nr:hypothetical protein DQ02_18675 [Citrobacter amalonaticus]